jgi:3-oxoacyl-(acyl-carrier-protein) synthase
MNRVVVTGLGAITPLGNDAAGFWENIKNGKCGVAPIASFDTTGYKSVLGAEVKDFDPEAVLDKKEAKRMDRYCQFAMAAAEEAYKDASLESWEPTGTDWGLLSVPESGTFNHRRTAYQTYGKRPGPGLAFLYTHGDQQYGGRQYCH